MGVEKRPVVSKAACAYSRRVDVDHTSATSETVVPAAINDSADSDLPQSGSAHHAWLDRDVEGDGGERSRVGR